MSPNGNGIQLENVNVVTEPYMYPTMRLNPSFIESQRAYYLRKRLEVWKEMYPITEEPRPEEVAKFGRSIFKLLARDGKVVFRLLCTRYIWQEIREYLTYHGQEGFIHAIYGFYNNDV